MTTEALMNTYGPRRLTLLKGEGSYVWDSNDNQYLDAIAGIAVCGLGHAHPTITETINRQASTLIHTSNLYNLVPQEQLAEKLRQISGMTNMFFGNSGAEANEAAIKLARLHGSRKGVAEPTIVVMDNAFHGRTLATLTATANPKAHKGFGPLVQGFTRVAFGDANAVAEAITKNDNIVAIMVEPIQGEGGIHTPSDDYLVQLRALCDQHDLLLILDEIQTGNGRTGKYFAYQHADILPDVVTTAKGLGNGVPIGVCMASGEAAQLMQPGSHGSTFGGNPLACAVGLSVIETLENENLIERAARLGESLKQQFRDTLNSCPQVVDIRGQGLMIGIELDAPCTKLVEQAADNGVLITVTADKVIRLLPPLTLSDEEAHLLVSKLTDTIQKYCHSQYEENHS